MDGRPNPRGAARARSGARGGGPYRRFDARGPSRRLRPLRARGNDHDRSVGGLGHSRGHGRIADPSGARRLPSRGRRHGGTVSDLEHWSTDGATPEEARLLAAARGGGPSAAARARIAGVVGVGAAMASIAPAAMKVPIGAAKWLAGKWIMLAIVGTLTAGAAWQLARVGPASDGPSVGTTAAAAPRASVAAQGVVPSSRLAETSEMPPSPAAPLALSAVPMPTPAPTTPTPTERARAKAATAAPMREDGPRPAASSIDAELALLERAKESLDRRRPAAALATVAEYEQRHPHGVLAIEAQVIRIEALAQAGRMQEASSAAHAFLAAHPNTVQAARVRSLAREIDPSP